MPVCTMNDGDDAPECTEQKKDAEDSDDVHRNTEYGALDDSILGQEAMYCSFDGLRDDAADEF